MQRVAAFLLSVLVFGSTHVAHAEVACGDILPGGTPDNWAVHTTSRDLLCPENGISMPDPYTIFACGGHLVRNVGAQGGVGIKMGGHDQQVDNCGASNWQTGILMGNCHDCKVTRDIPSAALFHNGMGLFVRNSTNTEVDGVLSQENTKQGIGFLNVYRPTVSRVTANGNGGAGILFRNAIEPLVTGSQARGNRRDVVFADRTHDGDIVESTVGSLVFRNRSRRNHWCHLIFDSIVTPGPTNTELCR